MPTEDNTRRALLDAAMGGTRVVTARADWKTIRHGGGVILGAADEARERARFNGRMLGMGYRNLLEAADSLPEVRVVASARDAVIGYWRLRAETSEQSERERETADRVNRDRRAYR